MREINFSDIEWRNHIESLSLPADLREWVLVQVSRGQNYYINRIHQLGLRGHNVLDAGCGMGNWSLGLSRWFEQVHAMEIDGVRLGVIEGIIEKFADRFAG